MGCKKRLGIFPDRCEYRVITHQNSARQPARLFYISAPKNEGKLKGEQTNATVKAELLRETQAGEIGMTTYTRPGARKCVSVCSFMMISARSGTTSQAIFSITSRLSLSMTR
jgi:hypothetical protein